MEWSRASGGQSGPKAVSEAREKGVKAMRGQKLEADESTIKSLVSFYNDRSCHGGRGKAGHLWDTMAGT